ncbi:MAG TPA: ABC transporter permease [Bryobacteraceae bacterium]
MADFRYALRTLRRQPVFALVAVLTLALGIGANTAIFSLVYHVLLRPLPYPEAGRLVFIWNAARRDGLKPMHVSIPDYLDRRAEAPAIEDAALFTPRAMTLSAGQQPEQLNALAVTPSFFSTLRRGPFLGRAFTPEDARPNQDRFVILTHALWTSHFAADRSLPGRTIRLNGETYVVAGVLPADFELPARQVSLLVPFAFTDAQMSDQARGNEFSLMIARLRPGATIGQVNAQMQTIVNRLIERLPARAAFMRNSGFTGIAIAMRDQLVGDVRTWLYLLQAGVLVLLLIACANVANLLLMRASGRQHELAVRTALGAGQWRIARQLLAEGAVLSLFGAAGGVLAAAFGVRGLLALAADQLPEISTAVIHPVVLAFTAAVAVLTAAVFGLVPALPAIRGRFTPALKQDLSRGSSSKRTGTLRAALVVTETALAVVLLVAAGLLVKGFARLTRVDPGFTADHVLTAQIELPAKRYADPVSMRAFWTRLLEKTRQIPGVAAAGFVSSVPFNGKISSGTYSVVGRALGPGDTPPHGRLDQVSGDYFRAMGIPVIEGRTFGETVDPQGPRLAVVDEFLARRQFPGTSPLGRQLNFGGPRDYSIIGVVRTINDSDLAKPVPEERVYLSAEQIPLDGMGLVVKTSQDPTAIASAVRDAVRAVDPDQGIAHVRTMDQWVAGTLAGRRTPMTLLALFGAVALLLSAIGIYGVLSFAVSQRVRELAIRQALGADRSAILALVLRQGLGTAGAGIAAGLVVAAVATRYLKSFLYAVGAHDAGVFGGVTVLLLAIAAAACYIPARRATQVDPVVALRDM